VYPGDEITLRGRIAERKAVPRAKGGLVRFDLELVNQHGAVVSAGSLRLLMRLRG
jgi:acyl dehydratase